MSITELHIHGYRSIRDMRLPLTQLNVITGTNGSGKSNLHRALYLLHVAATGNFARTLAEEGGMPSVLWAGPRRKGPVRLTLGVALSDGLSFEMVCGLPEPNELPTQFAFKLDPVFKEETLTFRSGKVAATLLERGRTGVDLRNAEGKRVSFPMALSRNESVLTQIADPHQFPHLTAMRDKLQSWRFYHHFRTDDGAPVRQPQVGVFTPVLSHHGTDLAVALQTILEIGDADGLHQSVQDGLGARLRIVLPEGNGLESRYRIQLETPGLLRPLEAWEMSDGTLRYLCLIAALLSPRPPQLLALNEPEASLHPDLIPPLAERIVDASRRSQIWLSTHSEELGNRVERISRIPRIRLKKSGGETEIEGD